MNTKVDIARLARSADARYQRGDYQRAAAEYHQAVTLAQTCDAITPLELSSLLNSLGIVCKYLGAYDEAEASYRRSLAIAEQVLGPDDAWFASLYHNLGGLEHARGRHVAGEPFAR